MHAATSRLLVAVLLLALALSGCADVQRALNIKKPITPRGQTGDATRPPGPVTKGDPRSEADEAFQSGDFRRAETLYRRLVEDPQYGPAEKSEAWRRIGEIAQKNADPKAGLAAAKARRTVAPKVVGDPEWVDLYLWSMRGLPDRAEKLDALDAARLDGGLSGEVRAKAQALLGLEYARMGEFPRAAQTLAEARTKSPDPAALERFVAAESPNLDAAAKSGLTKAAGEAAWLVAALAGTAGSGGTASAVQPGVQTVILLLPLSGNLGDVGSKILAGVKAGKAEVEAAGARIGVEVLNTEAADWRERLKALPKSASLVGGPLTVNHTRELAADPALLDGRALFAFLPSLSDLVEGRQAWRFFLSPRDQARTLAKAARTAGAAKAGVLYPDQRYGRTMSDLFREEFKAQGGAIVAETVYPAASTDWNEIVGALVAKHAFDAAFIGADWKEAQAIAPEFLTHKREGTILLGTAVWGQAIARSSFMTERDFERALFPAAFDSGRPSAAVDALKQRLGATPDSWHALGYDFIRFAALLGALEPGTGADSLNARLGDAARRLDFAQAPITWDASGQAVQDLFLQKPSSQGAIPANPEDLRR